MSVTDTHLLWLTCFATSAVHEINIQRWPEEILKIHIFIYLFPVFEKGKQNRDINICIKSQIVLFNFHISLGVVQSSALYKASVRAAPSRRERWRLCCVFCAEMWFECLFRNTLWNMKDFSPSVLIALSILSETTHTHTDNLTGVWTHHECEFSPVWQPGKQTQEASILRVRKKAWM